MKNPFAEGPTPLVDRIPNTQEYVDARGMEKRRDVVVRVARRMERRMRTAEALLFKAGDRLASADMSPELTEVIESHLNIAAKEDA